MADSKNKEVLKQDVNIHVNNVCTAGNTKLVIDVL